MGKVARTIQIAALIFAVTLVQSIALAADRVDEKLVEFGFDDGTINLDQNVFKVWERGRGSVAVVSHKSFSGYRAMEIRDRANDQEFPELQGYFSRRSSGKIYLHFALLVETPDDEFNIAVAGSNGFHLKKDGIALWISGNKGWLQHTTDSIPTKIFRIKAHVWYVFKIALDIDQGRYDLAVAEGQDSKPFLELKNQVGAANQKGSSVDKVSFIGDNGDDESNASFLVDDVVVSASNSVTTYAPSAARKSLYIDGWYELKKAMTEKWTCPRVFEVSEIGIQGNTRAEISRSSITEKIRMAATNWSPFDIDDGFSPQTQSALTAIQNWAAGCQALRAGNAKIAEENFRKAIELNKDAPVFGLSLVHSLASQKKWDEVDLAFADVYPSFRNDPRFDLALAFVAVNRQDLAEGAKALEKFSQKLLTDLRDPQVLPLWQGQTSNDVVAKLKTSNPLRWKENLKQPFIAEQYFYLLIWQQRTMEAQSFAEAIVHELSRAKAKTGYWDMLAGDTFFYLSQPQMALSQYLKAMKDIEMSQTPDLAGRISDAYFTLGNREQEVRFREIERKLRATGSRSKSR